jgi:hypothetical protein
MSVILLFVGSAGWSVLNELRKPRALCSVCYFFRFSRDPLAIATNIMPAAPSASMRIVSIDIPTLSRAINPSNSAVATAAVSPRITSTHRFMWRQ